MAIFRTQKSSNFTTVRNEFIGDPSLTAKAKGLLLYLLSKPDDWITRIDDIAAHMADGVDSIRSGLKELESARYLIKRRIHGERGRFEGWETLVYETPLPSLDSSSTETGFPDYGKTRNRKTPKSENPKSENPTLLNTDLKLNTEEELNTDPCGTDVPHDRQLALNEPTAKKRKASKNEPRSPRLPPAVSKHHPDLSVELWKIWSPMYVQFYEQLDDRPKFMNGFDWLIEQDVEPEKISHGLKVYVQSKQKAIANGRKDSVPSPPRGDRFFLGKEGGESYCLRAYEMAQVANPLHLTTGLESTAFIEYVAKALKSRPEYRDVTVTSAVARVWIAEAIGNPKRQAAIEVYRQDFQGLGQTEESVQAALGSELYRLKRSALLPDEWQHRTGASLARDLELSDAIAYLSFLKGFSCAETI